MTFENMAWLIGKLKEYLISFPGAASTAIKLRNTLVPKLQLGNPDSEAPASRDGKLELPALNSQAGAWELAQSGEVRL